MRANYQLILAGLVVATASAPVRAQTVAVTGAKIYPVSGPVIERGSILFRDGRITAVGADIAIPADARRIDGTGKVVTPGLVNGATQLGIVEVGAVRDTREGSARGHDGIAAAFNGSRTHQTNGFANAERRRAI